MDEVAKLERIVDIQKQAIDRWVPCSGHRDKTPPQFCPVCEIERLESAMKRAMGLIRMGRPVLARGELEAALSPQRHQSEEQKNGR